MKVRSHGLRRSFVRGIALLYTAVVVASAPSTARAAGVVGTGTAASCTDAALNAALAGGGLVTFDCGPDPATIDISTGAGTKTIDTDTTIDGAGLITINGGGVVEVPDGVTLNLHGVVVSNAGEPISNSGTLSVTNSTFSNNRFSFSNTIINCLFLGGQVGGAISNCGTLSVTNSTFSNNAGSISGGAITNSGTLVVTGSTFVGNEPICILCGGAGGAIANTGTLTVINSTFVDNFAGVGGAIINYDRLNVTNSTFIGNRSGAGGGIENAGGTLSVINCTFSGNSGQDGGGGISNIVEVGAGPVTVTNSIFSADPSDNCKGPITDGGHNLDDGTSCGFSTATGSLVNTNPQLDPLGLQNNGGPTDTVALCAGAGMPTGCTAASPAIDAGDQAVCAAAPVNDGDQRGFVRPGTGHTNCSIGAYEADAIALCIGDCNSDGVVAINELILGVNIVLAIQPETTCQAFANAQGVVDIAQLIPGVNNALDGCGG